MSWIGQLYRTYQQAEHLTDLPEDQLLPPIGHTSQNAHIHVVLDGEGHFRRAEVWKKKAVILPATEKSESRANVDAPHGLADKIQYVAQEYAAFGGTKKAYFPSFHTQLRDWVESKHSHPSAKAILSYLEKGQLVRDLVAAKIIHLDDQQQFITEWSDSENPAPELFQSLPKTKGVIEIGDALVAWSVERPDCPQSHTWEDRTLHQSWVDFLLSQDAKQGLCVVKGETAPIARLHPSKIRHTGDKAKLISANDDTGFTYRGRFTSSVEATSISAEVTQKAHAALRWLIGARKQAQRNGDQVTVAWALSGKDIPNPMGDFATEVLEEKAVDDFDDDPVKPEEAMAQPQMTLTNTHARDFGQRAAHALKKKLQGYRAKLNHHDQLSILALDSATTGRMAITYYQQLMPDEYFSALQRWQDDFQWYQRYTQELPQPDGKKPKSRTVYPIVAPSPYAIAQAAYGRALSDELKKQACARILPSIVEPIQAFPLDLMRRCVALACNRQGFESWEWERNLGVACAVYKGYYARHPQQHERRSFTVALDDSNHSRDYLYGRLLAVAERIERVALDVAGENRSTTAERYFQQFADRPSTTWRNISTALRPYQERLRNNRGGFLTLREKELSEITDAFNRDAFMDDTRLTGEFLLGYHSQRMSYRKTSDPTSTDDTNNQAESTAH